MKRNKIGEGLDALFFAGLGGFLLNHSLTEHQKLQTDWYLSPYLFPAIIAGLILAATLIFLIEIIGKKDSKPDKQGSSLKPARLLLLIGLIFAYYFVMSFFGFVIATILFLACLLYLLEVRKIWILVGLPIGVSFGIHFLFGTLLHVLLP